MGAFAFKTLKKKKRLNLVIHILYLTIQNLYWSISTSTCIGPSPTPPPPGDQVMSLSPNSVRRSLSRINARKAPGPDNIPGRVLRDCAVELTDVFTDIFNISLSQAVVPTCFKATTITPVLKKSSPSCFNDYRPVALTPILMKCFERLVMQHIKSSQVKLSFIVIPLHVGSYSGTRCRASQDHGAT